MTATSQIPTTFNGKFTTIADIDKFMFAGNACITLVSRRTGERFTYRIKKAEDHNFWFVSLLTRPDNDSEKSYSYFGHINATKWYTYGSKAKIGPTTSSVKAWEWFYNKLYLFQSDKMFEGVEVWHEGRCGRCNRKLTVPSSISSGFGPECINHV